MRTHIILTLAIIVLCMATTANAKYSGGTGEPNDPYQISDDNDLLELAGEPNDYGKCFILTTDVDLAGQVFTTAIIAPVEGYPDNSFDGTAFTGTFDGNGHKIAHFTIDGENFYLGLFGYVDSGGSVKNLSLEDCAVSGYMYVGALVGGNSGSISNCYSTCTVSSFGENEIGGLVGTNNAYGSISKCYSTGTASGECYIGGIVGSNNAYGSVSKCYSTGMVSRIYGTGSCCGGLVGGNFGNISNCSSTGMVSSIVYVGGLVGENSGSVSNCYSTGFVIGDEVIGGLVGGNAFGNVSSSFWDTQTSGQPTSAGGEGKTTAEMKMMGAFTDAGWDFVEIWDIGENQTYPYLRTELAGDLNHDRKVDFEDLAILGLHWLERTGP